MRKVDDDDVYADYMYTGPSMDAPFEYGIRHKRDFEMHRTGFQTYEEAEVWMTEGWDDMNPYNVFEIVRRSLGRWSAIKPKM